MSYTFEIVERTFEDDEHLVTLHEWHLVKKRWLPKHTFSVDGKIFQRLSDEQRVLWMSLLEKTYRQGRIDGARDASEAFREELEGGLEKLASESFDAAIEQENANH